MLIPIILVVSMKESGVGQTSFTIIPREIGLLPYPSVYIHECNPDFNVGFALILSLSLYSFCVKQFQDKDVISESTVLGERLSSYHRLQGRQVRVLAPKQGNEDAASNGAATSSTTGSIRLALKERSFQRLKKLIDRD